MAINSVICTKCSLFYTEYYKNKKGCVRCGESNFLVKFPMVEYSPTGNFIPKTFVTTEGCTFGGGGAGVYIDGGVLKSKDDSFIGCEQVVISKNKAKVELVNPTIED